MTDNTTFETSNQSEQASVDARANVLNSTFQHYFRMAMDHHAKAGTTSNFLLVIVGAIISFVSLDNINGGTVNIVSGLAVFVLGLFGGVWTWKQHERYAYWQHIAHEYQKELVKIVPGLKFERTYRPGAKDTSTEKYNYFFAVKLHERWLWVSLHGFISVLGLGLIIFGISNMN